MLDSDLAELYGVEVRALNQAVQRNRDRFPNDFMFRLNDTESAALRSQSVISKSGRGGRRHLPHAFTEQGVAMLSTVLRSARAIQVNIEIMRAFVRMRGLIREHQDLAVRLDALESKYDRHDRKLKEVFDAIRALMEPEPMETRPIGFRTEDSG